MQGLKVPFGQFFRMGLDGRALLVQPSKVSCRNSKIFLFWVSITPYKDWKEKLERAHFAKIQSVKITV
jgi:hypothetical protein